MSDSLVVLFSNRLEVWNPSQLPSPLNPAKRRVAHASVLVNRLIAESLYLNEYIERMGTGTLDMVRRCTEVGLPEPDFSDTGQFVTTAWRTSMVTIRSDKHPVSDANVLMLLPNGTWKRATTNENGEALLETESRSVPLDVLVAAKGFSAHVERGWVPAVHPLSLELQGVDGGAAIFSELTGEIQGLKGLLKFTRDSRGRIYLNAANVSINDSQPQPMHCSLGEELHLVDSDGDDLAVRIVDVVGQSALVEYRTSRHQDSQSHSQTRRQSHSQTRRRSQTRRQSHSQSHSQSHWDLGC